VGQSRCSANRNASPRNQSLRDYIGNPGQTVFYIVAPSDRGYGKSSLSESVTVPLRFVFPALSQFLEDRSNISRSCFERTPAASSIAVACSRKVLVMSARPFAVNSSRADSLPATSSPRSEKFDLQSLPKLGRQLSRPTQSSHLRKDRRRRRSALEVPIAALPRRHASTNTGQADCSNRRLLFAFLSILPYHELVS
jgi:hypothetical protein